MHCTTQHPFLRDKPVQVKDIWEVLISIQLWKKIRELAQKRNCTFTTITRYCAFRLAEKQKLRWNHFFRNAHDNALLEHRKIRHHHRHMVCLYGEDVLLLRMAALRLGLTVSAFLRLALHIYLPKLAAKSHGKKQISATELFWRGIKRWKQISLTALNHGPIPAIRQFTFSSFMPWEWWGKPESGFA